MNIIKAISTVVATSLGFGIIGSAIGAFLGRFTPGFFTQLLPLRDIENFNPVEFGVGMGLVNGLTWGLVIGVLIVGIISWKEARMRKQDKSGPM